MEHSQHTQKLATTTTLNAAQPPGGRRKNNPQLERPTRGVPEPIAARYAEPFAKPCDEHSVRSLCLRG